MARYRMKEGCGRHYLRKDGQETIVEPGDVVECDEWQLGGGKRKFELVGPPDPPPVPTVGLKVKHKGGGRWVVLNEVSGAQINDGYLTKREAVEMATGIAPFTEDENEELEPINTKAGMDGTQ